MCGTVAGILALSSHAEPLPSGIAFREVQQRSYLSYVTETVDNLIEFGTDRYGTVQTRLLVSNLDVRTKENSLAQNFAAADQAWRVERRSPGGSNFLHNQSLHRAIDKTARVTRDLSYRQFVTDNFASATENLVDSHGMFWWGYHRHYDVHTDTFESESGTPNREMHSRRRSTARRRLAPGPRSATSSTIRAAR